MYKEREQVNSMTAMDSVTVRNLQEEGREVISPAHQWESGKHSKVQSSEFFSYLTVESYQPPKTQILW